MTEPINSYIKQFNNQFYSTGVWWWCVQTKQRICAHICECVGVNICMLFNSYMHLDPRPLYCICSLRFGLFTVHGCLGRWCAMWAALHSIVLSMSLFLHWLPLPLIDTRYVFSQTDTHYLINETFKANSYFTPLIKTQCKEIVAVHQVVMHPMKQRMSRLQGVAWIGVIWVMGSCFSLPHAIYQKLLRFEFVYELSFILSCWWWKSSKMTLWDNLNGWKNNDNVTFSVGGNWLCKWDE